jgi:hypothetical protein
METLYMADCICVVWFVLAVSLMKPVAAVALWELARENCCHFVHAVPPQNGEVAGLITFFFHVDAASKRVRISYKRPQASVAM